MMMITSSFSSSSLAYLPRSSPSSWSPKTSTKFKNPKPFPGPSKTHPASPNSLSPSHPIVESPSVKCFSRGPSSAEQENQKLVQPADQRYEFERLFSNLNQATLKREPGSLSSAIFLVAGTTVGAGILAIPAVTQESGFLASAVICIFCWIYMASTGLLIAEVNVNTMCELGSGGVSLVSMAKRTLGNIGVQVACWTYLFIHYALLVAYIARSSEILTNFLGIPQWETAALFSLLFGGLCYFGSQRVVGAVNGALVIGIITSFTVLVIIASGDLHWDTLLKANFAAAPQSTAIPLALFLVWNGVILGTNITATEMSSQAFVDPLQQLRSTSGVVGPIVDGFSLLAIATSYIGFILGLADFLADLLKQPTGENRPLPYVLTLVPPLILSLLDPEIFFKALDFAGTYGVLVLFGVLPAAMSWSDRYTGSSDSRRVPALVGGGKFTLLLIMGGAATVILSELLENFGHW